MHSPTYSIVIPVFNEEESFGALVARLRSAGCDVVPDDALLGVKRVYVADPFGNRIELMAE
jgi:glycosyltransferase involved in cell wall biosynthesis